jgi:CBS domain-containing protein
VKRTVADVMTSPAITVPTTAGFKEIVTRLQEAGISAVPVLDEAGRLAGVVSEGDLLLKEEREHLEERPRILQSPSTRAARAKAEGLTAGELMSSPALAVGPDTPIAEAARIMHEKRVKRLPVVDNEGSTVGVVSRADLLKVFARDDEDIRQEVVREVIVDALWIEPATLNVAVREGVVHVKGEVERKSEIRLLEKLIARVDGVVRVETELTYREDDSRYRPQPKEPWAVAP